MITWLARPFEFDIAHLEVRGLGAGVRWRLVMQDVTMLLARTWQIWPGPALSRSRGCYFIARITVHDPVGYGRYLEGTDTALARWGATVLAVDESAIVLEGLARNAHGPDRVSR